MHRTSGYKTAIARAYPSKSPSLPSNKAAVHRTQARTLVNLSILDALTRSPAGLAASEHFGFQPRSACIAHSEGLREDIANQLKAQEVVTQAPAEEGFLKTAVRQLFQPNGLTHIPVRSAQQLTDLCDTHGPITLVMQGLVAPGQGLDVYALHHSVVMLGSVSHDGRTVGVLVDANDLQTNEVMAAVHRWRSEQGLLAPLSDMTGEQLTSLDQWLQEQQPPMALGQVAFRLVDLDAVVQQSDDLYVARAGMNDAETGNTLQPNRAKFDSRDSVLAPLLTPSTCERIRAAIDDNPAIVETAWSAPPETPRNDL